MTRNNNKTKEELLIENEQLKAKIFELKETQRKVQEITESQKFQKSLLDTSPDIIYLYDILAKKNIYSNIGITKVLGYDVDEIKMMGDKLIEFLMHKDDYEKYISEIIPLYYTAKDSDIIENKYRMLHKGGSWRWLHSKEKIFSRDEEKSPIQIFGIISDVTERTQAQDAQLKSEKKYHELVNLAQEGIWVIDENNNTTFTNPSMAKILGYSQEEMLGKSLFDFMDEAGVKLADKKLKRRKEGLKEQYDFEFICKNGERVFCTLAATPIIDDAGNYQGALAGVIDISERINEERILNIELKLFEYAIDHSEEEFLRKFLDEAERITESKIGFYHYIEDDQESISLQTWSSNTLDNMCRGLGENTRHYPISEAGVWVDCIKERKPVVHNDYSSLTHKKGLPKGHAPILRELVVPVIRGNMIKAVLGVGNKESDYKETDVINLQRLADIAWETVVRKQAEGKTRIAEENLKHTFDLSPSIISKANLNTGYFVEANKAVTRILGYSVEEFKSKTFIELIHPEDRQRTVDEISAQLKGKDLTSFENRYLCKNGAYKWIAWHGTKPNEYGVVTAIGSDITERKLAEEKISKGQFYLTKAQELGKIGTWNIDIPKNTLTWTDETYNIFGLLPGTPLNFEIFMDCIHPEDRDFVYQEWTFKMMTNNYDIEHRIVVDGEVKWVREKAEITYDKAGRPIEAIGFAQDITERKLAQEAIIESEEKFRAIFENSTDGKSITYFDGSIKTNAAYCAIVGYSQEELSKLKWQSITHPDDIAGNIAISNAILSGEKDSERWEKRYIKKNADIVWVDISTTLQRDKKGEPLYFITSIIDITERKNSELQLKKTLYEQSLILANDPAFILFKDVKNNIIRVNDTAAKMTGLPKEQIEGQPSKEIYPDMADVYYADDVQVMNSGKPKKGIIERLPAIDGSEKWLLTDKIPYFNANNEIEGILVFSTDITELKRYENTLIDAKQKAEESDRLKSAFLANMSHEIRTPMNGILGFAELLKEPNLSGEKQQKYISIIEKSGARMLNIINDIVDISKIEAGLMRLEITESDINEQIEYIYTFFKPEVEAKGIKLSFNIALPAKEAIIKTDREKIFAILTNLVKNAIKYSNEGFIEFGYDKKGNSLEFFVKDSGIGIPKERQSAIFERFIQADIEDKMARQGAGLGLAITKAYVEMLGGRIWVESEVGRGSTFYFTIPYDTVSEKTSGANINDLSDDFPTFDLKVLIVEDDETSSELLSIILDKYAKDIITVNNGTQALETFRDNQDIGLIMMDIQIPDMNGLEVSRNIRAINNDVIIIAQTAYGLAGDQAKAINAGCTDYISKPINKDELESLIRKHIRNKCFNN